MRKLLIAALALLPSAVAIGCGGGGTVTETVTVSAESSRAGATTAANEKQAQAVVDVREPEGMSGNSGPTIHKSTVLLRGTVDPPGADVTVNGESAHVRGDEWYYRVPLDMGDNNIVVSAEAEGYDKSKQNYYLVTRKKTAAQIAQEKAEAEADFKNSATTIDYAQLIKDPGYHAGEHVVYRGEILQIQQSGKSGFMLVWTTCDEFDICDDPIYVPYDGFRVQGAEGDQITIYGTVKGGYEYDTQGGGTNYVPKIRAMYVEE